MSLCLHVPHHPFLVHTLLPSLPLSQVVMAVVQLYYHLAPQSEQGVVTKALIRLLRGHRFVSVCVRVCVCWWTMKESYSPSLD